MKKLISKIVFASVMVFSIAFIMPQGFTLTGNVVQAKVTISKKKHTLTVGRRIRLKLNGRSKRVKWSSSNKKVAKVSSSGKVTAKKVGKATVYAKTGRKKFKCKIKVEKPILNINSLEVNSGSSFKIRLMNNTQDVEWVSNDKSVAKVYNGKVTGVSEGEAKITAIVDGKKYKCAVSVTNYTDYEDIEQQQYRYEIFKNVNNKRIKEGLKPLKMLEALNKAAMIRAKECSKKFSHVRPNGKSCFTVLKEVGLNTWWRRAENLAEGFTNPSLVYRKWMSSSSHRKSILSPEYVYTGIAYTVINDQCYWVQEFYTK